MRLARQIGADENPCMSRKVGALIVHPVNHATAIGYNNTPRKYPHCDSQDYVDYFVDSLTKEEKEICYKRCVDSLYEQPIYTSFTDQNLKSTLLSFLQSNKICPRKLIWGSGERLDLCPAIHAEHNAILNSCFDVRGCSLFMWGPVPCRDCAKVIIQAGLKDVYCTESYSDKNGVYMLNKMNIPIIILDWDIDLDCWSEKYTKAEI